MAKIEDKIENRISKIIQDLGYKLYDVQYVKEGKDYYLRIFIDKQEGIDLNDCEKVNNEINNLLDEADYIKEQYFLEVSSPGIERTLRKEKHFIKSIDAKILVKLYNKAENGKKEIEGILREYNKEMNFERKNISLIKKYYDWDNN